MAFDGMLLSFALWVQSTAFFTALREERGWANLYPIILSLHMVAIAFFGGTILMTDMRLLGWAMTDQPVSDVIDQLRRPKRIGFLLAVGCGALMLGCKAEEYYLNVFFRIKLLLLMLVSVHAFVFRNSVYKAAAQWGNSRQLPRAAKLAATLSLVLWVSIACAGRAIGYIEVPFGIHAGTFQLRERLQKQVHNEYVSAQVVLKRLQLPGEKH